MSNYIKTTIVNTILCLLLCGDSIATNEESYSPSKSVLSEKNLQRLNTVVANVKNYYYKSVGEDVLFDGAISGMLSGLDPHSEYLGPEALKDLKMATFGKFSGIGVEVIPDRGAIKVVSPIDDTPAYRVGIKPGDYIIQINNKFVRDMTLGDAINMMRGPKGSKVKLTILRKNENKPKIFELKREVIKVKSVKDAQMLEPGYGYIRLSIFQESTERDMVKEINKLKSKNNLNGLIIDLRNNPGGLFESAVEVADDFLDAKKLKKNDLIVYTKGQNNDEQIVAHASNGELLPGVPLVVLINEGSASAAEIVAGSLRDHSRAIVVGTRSFGKGSVQVVLPIDKKSAIKLTTALYYTPLGHSIQAKGIEPDISVEDIQIPQKDDEEQILPRIDESTLVDHIKNGDDEDNGTKEKPVSQHVPPKARPKLMYYDYQLHEALNILKSQYMHVAEDKKDQSKK